MALEANIPETKKKIINYSNNNPKSKEIENIRLKEKEFNYLLLVIISLFIK